MPLALLSLLFTGAIFGFFYAWVCSTMWGLEAADPAIAIAAMQAMNASVRNAVFAPAFFGTPIVLLLTGLWLWSRARRSAMGFMAAALIYGIGAMGLTLAINVPMNEALALVDSHQDRARVWQDYSSRWQVWNQMRTLVSGVALLLAGWATWTLGREQVG